MKYSIHVHFSIDVIGAVFQVVEVEDYVEWVELRREAELALENREQRLFQTAKLAETQLELLGEGSNHLIVIHSCTC